MANREEVLARIHREESRIADLRAEVEATDGRLAVLREQLAATSRIPNPSMPVAIPTAADVPATNAAKVTLFRSLLRGRDDVFPRRWENSRTGKSGYSPACSNE